MKTIHWYLASVLCSIFFDMCSGFSIILLARRGKGNLKQRLVDENRKGPKNSVVGQQQEITGVTLPKEGTLKGWEIGEGESVVVANVSGEYFSVQGDCPRCAFDLWKGDIVNDDAFEDLPRVACPTCSTTYSLRSGKVGPPLRRKGLQNFVGNLAKTATEGNAMKDAKAFAVAVDEAGRVLIGEKKKR